MTATEQTATATTSTPQARTTPQQAPRAIGWWLIAVCGLVIAILLLGGYTRLTNSGLSMTEWQPASLLPPSDEAAWQAEFASYQQSPEYRHINHGMSLQEFKNIYYPEFYHRILARLLGLVLFVPFVWFLVRRQIPRALLPRLIGVCLLAAMQGVIGWLMVSSGLNERPDVSHYRLAIHLLAAFAIFSWMLWLALGILLPADRTAGTTPQARRSLRTPVIVIAVMTVITATWGAFVAGLDAGHMYNHFPLMGDHLWPDFIGDHRLLLAPFESPGVVQFVHRVLAITTFCCGIWLALRLYRSELPWRTRRIIWLVPAMILVQFVLGVTTLLLVVPVGLGMAHQAGALALLSCALIALAQLHEPDLPPAAAEPLA